MYIFYAFLTAAAFVSALPFFSNPQTKSVSQIYQFPDKDRWFENIVVRADGKILATELTNPNLWLIDPEASSNNIQLVRTLPQYLGLLGIVEYRPNVFAFIAGNFSIAKGFVSSPDSYAVWSADFNTNETKVEKIADIPGAQFLNGMAYLSSDSSLLLGDAGLGVVWKLNLQTKFSTVVVADPLMKKITPDAPDGVNGLKVYGNELWFTRGFDAVVAKTKITNTGFALGASVIVGQNSSATWTMDDLIVNSHGQAFVAIPFENAIARYDGNGAAPVIVAGNINSTEIAEPTSLAFGRLRGKVNENVMYVATGGAIADPVNGNLTFGGQIVKIQLR